MSRRRGWSKCRSMSRIDEPTIDILDICRNSGASSEINAGPSTTDSLV